MINLEVMTTIEMTNQFQNPPWSTLISQPHTQKKKYVSEKYYQKILYCNFDHLWYENSHQTLWSVAQKNSWREM